MSTSTRRSAIAAVLRGRLERTFVLAEALIDRRILGYMAETMREEVRLTRFSHGAG